MTVHPISVRRQSSDVAGTRLTSADLFGESRWPRRRVLLRRRWVRAAVDPVASDHSPATIVTAPGEFVGRDRRAA